MRSGGDKNRNEDADGERCAYWYVEGLIEDGLPVPQPGRIEEQHRKAEYRGGTWAVVSMDPASLRSKAVRVNITVPERVLDVIDRYAKTVGCTRSGLLIEAVTAYMGRAEDQPAHSGTRSKRSAATKKRK